MALILKPLHPVFVAEATGLDLTNPISRADSCEINAAMNQYGVLVWRGQPLTAQQQIRFATAFGPLDIGLKRVFKRPERVEDERLIDISNVAASKLRKKLEFDPTIKIVVIRGKGYKLEIIA